jgi:hypothetical protein
MVSAGGDDGFLEESDAEVFEGIDELVVGESL